jgi:hypothetical protein
MRDGVIIDEVRLTQGDEPGDAAAVSVLVQRLSKHDL